MGLFSGCLLLSDIDGTLLCKGKIPPRNLEWIEYYKAEGGFFSIATGRALTAARYSYDLSHSNAPIVACHGGFIYDYQTEKVLYQAKLPEEFKNVLPQIMEKFPTVGVEIHSGKKIYELRSTKDTLWHRDYESLVFETPPYDVNRVSWTKVLFAVDTVETLNALKNACAGFHECRFLNTCCHENAIYYEALPHGVHKGSALAQLKQLTNATFTLAIGDYYNDAEMIQAADFGAATAGAPEEIKQLANFVTGPCETGAVADFIIKAKQIMSERK